MRSRGPTSLMVRRRVAVLAGAVAVGIVAVLFARASDAAGELFGRFATRWRWAPLALTPAGFVALVWITRRYAPLARGSGIPQVMVARGRADLGQGDLIAPRTVLAKIGLTLGAVLTGASVGREGPTVQLAAAVMALSHRLMRVPMRASVVIAGGAAGVAAAFNTPLAGVLFAIEELASAYEQRVTLLVLFMIVIAGMVAQGVSGDYLYFGAIGAQMSLRSVIVMVPVAGILGGLAGGLFARFMLFFATGAGTLTSLARSRPLLFAGFCGLIVALIGCATQMTWGTGYAPARAMLLGGDVAWWFGPAKFTAALATAIAGLPGGIFAPSLSVGAGFGNLLHLAAPGQPVSAVIILGMAAYFTGVVRAPLTAVIILSETTASRGMMLPMFAAAFLADWASTQVCREKLYHGLARTFGH